MPYSYRRIRCNYTLVITRRLLYSPAFVKTRMDDNSNISDELQKKVIENSKKIQLLGLLNFRQVSEGIRFLCKSEMTTGVAFARDGGLLHCSKMS